MARSIKKGPYVENSLMRKVVKAQESGSKQVIKNFSGGHGRAHNQIDLPKICIGGVVVNIDNRWIRPG